MAPGLKVIMAPARFVKLSAASRMLTQSKSLEKKYQLRQKLRHRTDRFRNLHANKTQDLLYVRSVASTDELSTFDSAEAFFSSQTQPRNGKRSQSEFRRVMLALPTGKQTSQDKHIRHENLPGVLFLPVRQVKSGEQEKRDNARPSEFTEDALSHFTVLVVATLGAPALGAPTPTKSGWVREGHPDLLDATPTYPTSPRLTRRHPDFVGVGAPHVASRRPIMPGGLFPRTGDEIGQDRLQ